MTSVVDECFRSRDPDLTRAAHKILELDARHAWKQANTCMVCGGLKPRSVHTVLAMYRAPEETNSEEPGQNYDLAHTRRQLQICKSCENKAATFTGYAEFQNGFYLNGIAKEVEA